MSINKIHIISPNFIKEYSGFINSNVDNDLIDLSIIEAQDLELQGILGSNLYDSIMDKIVNDTLSGNTVYSNLVDKYCVKVILYYTLERCIDFLLSKFNNKNVGEQNSDNTTPIEKWKLINYKSKFNNSASDYSRKLINHLCQFGRSLYTEYNTETEAEDLRPVSTKYFSGLDLTSVRNYGNKRNCKTWLI